MQTIPMRTVESQGTEPLSTSQVARLLGVSIGTIRRWSDLGQLESFRTPSGTCRVSADQLRVFLDTLGPRTGHSPEEADAETPL